MRYFVFIFLMFASLQASRTIPLNNFTHFPIKKFEQTNITKIKTLAKVTNTYQKIETEHFRIYYGYNIPGTTAWNDDNKNGTYDFIDVLQESLELSWQKEVVELGFNSPTIDKIDVLIGNTGLFENGSEIIVDDNTIGYAEFGRFVLNGTINGTTPVMINDTTIYQTSSSDLLRITIAHEFMHILQLAYRNDMNPINIWFYEGMAVWAESFVYPNIYDFIYSYGGDLPLSIRNGLGDSGSYTVYSTVFFFKYLTKKYGNQIIKQAVESFGQNSQNGFYGVDAVLKNKNSSLLEEVYSYYTNLKTSTSDIEIVKLKEFLKYNNISLFIPSYIACANFQSSKNIKNFAYVEFDNSCDSYFASDNKAVFYDGDKNMLGYGINLSKNNSGFVLNYENFGLIDEDIGGVFKVSGKNNNTISLHTGWNLVSTQFDVNATIFEADGVELVWQFKNNNWLLAIPKNSQYFGATHSFSPLEKVDSTEGIWIKSSKNMELAFTPNTKGYCSMQNLKTGWNLWGNSCKNNLDFSNIDFYYGVIWGYDGTNWNIKTKTNETYGYTPLDTLKSQSGYWIYKN